MVAAACFLFAGPASARLSTDALDAIGVSPPPDARVPMSAALTDQDGVSHVLGKVLGGRPSVLIFADFTCRTLCGPILAFAADGLAKTGLKPGQDFGLVVVGLDPKDSAADARAMQRNEIGDGALATASVLLRADEKTVKAITAAVGYRYAYDPAIDQFAHPADVFVLTADGHVARTLSGLGLDAADLRLALVEAGEGRIGTFADRVHLLCYGFDPAKGIYTLTIQRWLAVAAALTLLALAAGIGFMLLRRPATRVYPAQSAPSEPA
jgi:protein SCO1/2